MSLLPEDTEKALTRDQVRSLSLAFLSLQVMGNKVLLFIIAKSRGWGHCSMVKSTCCSCRGPKFSSQHLHKAAHKHACTQVHTLAHWNTHIHIIKNQVILFFKKKSVNENVSLSKVWSGTSCFQCSGTEHQRGRDVAGSSGLLSIHVTIHVNPRVCFPGHLSPLLHVLSSTNSQ